MGFMGRRSIVLTSIIFLLFIAGASRADEVYYLSRGSSWRYFRGLSEASAPDVAAWRAPAFDDERWDSGAAPFGYGDPPYGTDLSQLAPPMQNNYTTLFLRQAFEVSDAGSLLGLQANLLYDDGLIVWLNGAEVLRINVAGQRGDPVTFDGVAAANREPGKYQNVEVLDPRQYLVTGRNVLAVQVFNFSKNNNDLKFDLELFDPEGPDLRPPAPALVVPGPGATLRRLPRIEVTFSEEVSG